MSPAEVRLASVKWTHPRPIPFGWQIATLDTVTAATGHRSVSSIRPAHKVWLSAYFLDIHEITIDEFNPYVRATDGIDGIGCRTRDSAVLCIYFEEHRATAF
jgi:hypothetical protein